MERLFKITIADVHPIVLVSSQIRFTLYLNEDSVKALFEGEEFISPIANPLKPDEPTVIRKRVLDALKIE